ncbi:MAG: signal peptidase II [Ruminococcaceae bacterium]|nr:signal peptidase II [Oscillospiraceae bacterium]
MKTVLTGLGTFAVCNAARWYLDRSSRTETELAGGRVRLTALRNAQAAFGVRVPSRVLGALSIAALGVACTQRRAHPVSTGLLLGGGAANLAERLDKGSVYDYVQFPKAPGRLKHYVFNLADFAILSGCAGLFLPRKK